MASSMVTSDFESYPPIARALALKQLALLQRLPDVFAALLLTEMIGYDWRFPAERAEIDRQLGFLNSMDEAQLAATMRGFRAIPASAEMEAVRWAAAPQAFIEKLTAYLWSVHQMDRFREVASAYQQALLAAPEPVPAIPRLVIVVIGRGAAPGVATLFTKLRARGTYFRQVKPAGGLDHLFAAVNTRVAAHPDAYAHWYVDGGAPYPSARSGDRDGLLTLSYEDLAPLRRALLMKVNTVRDAGDGVGPESLRSLLASLRPEQLGAAGGTAGGTEDAIKRHFELSLLTEGSGTQIFSTTFVQWAGRELLRRARPLTLVLRYAPRQTERSMDAMLVAEPVATQVDPAGSLIDADMGAYYTWINLMRLTGAEQASFVVWFEDQAEALVVAPGMARGVVSSASCDFAQLMRWATT